MLQSSNHPLFLNKILVHGRAKWQNILGFLCSHEGVQLSSDFASLILNNNYKCTWRSFKFRQFRSILLWPNTVRSMLYFKTSQVLKNASFDSEKQATNQNNIKSTIFHSDMFDWTASVLQQLFHSTQNQTDIFAQQFICKFPCKWNSSINSFTNL